MVRVSRVDSAAGHNQLDETPGLLQNTYGLLVGDIAVQRLAVDRQDLVALLEAAIPETQKKPLDAQAFLLTLNKLNVIH